MKNKSAWALLVTVATGMLLCAQAMAAWVVPSSTPQYTYTVQNDIVYGQGEIDGGGTFTDLKLDLYVPDIPEGATPTKHALMLMVHGGGFAGGSKTGAPVVTSAQEYAQRGWLVASIDYRLLWDDPVASSRVQALADFFVDSNSDALFRATMAALDDTLTALDFLQARADVVPQWTSLWGISAGAITVLSTGYSLDDHGITRPPVAVVIELAGENKTAVGTPFDDPTGSDPALMVIHGTSDFIVPYISATEIQTWAANSGLPFDFQTIVGGGHSVNMLGTNASTGVSLLQRSVDFQHETVFAGLQQGPQPEPPTGC